MPAIVRGKRGGTRALAKGRKSRTTLYTMRSSSSGKTVTFPIHAVVTYSKGRQGKNKAVTYLFASSSQHPPLNCMLEEYRLRFGIESSYRLLSKSRVRTSTRDPKLRVMYVATSLLLVNAWVEKKWDGLYRYEVMVGARADAEKAFRRIAYTADDFRENSKYKGTSLSKYSKLFLAEDSPYADGEKDSYSRPILLGMKRGSMTESLEGDYLDVHIYGMEDDLVGWIELSGTKTGNIPDVTTIRWVELISKIIGTAITSQNALHVVQQAKAQ